MPSDQTVTARAILRAENELRRMGHRQAMTELEQLEPDLSSHLWEQLSSIHRKILTLGGPPKTSHRCYRQVQHLMLVSIFAIRQAHHDLWQDLHQPPPPEVTPPEPPDDHNTD